MESHERDLRMQTAASKLRVDEPVAGIGFGRIEMEGAPEEGQVDRMSAVPAKPRDSIADADDHALLAFVPPLADVALGHCGVHLDQAGNVVLGQGGALNLAVRR